MDTTALPAVFATLIIASSILKPSKVEGVCADAVAIINPLKKKPITKIMLFVFIAPSPPNTNQY
jgi:hypothetical protein